MAASSNLSTLDVSNALEQLNLEETRELFFQLNVPLNALDDIAARFDGENRKEHFVQKWLNRNEDASWAKLVAGLRQIDMNSLATEIESVHLSRVPSSGSVSLIPSSALSPPPEVSTSANLETASVSATPTGTPTPSTSCSQMTASFQKKVTLAKANVEYFDEEFCKLFSSTRSSLSQREEKDGTFLDTFRDHLLVMSVSKKAVHIKFFCTNENQLLAAENIKILFAILSRYCNYTNYEIILHIVKRFCKEELKQRMLNYRDSLTVFEKVTTVDVYLIAISARPDGAISAGFIKMTMKMNRPSSECTLHEIRELKESIEEACVESYVMYIQSPGEGSVCVCLRIPERVGWMVGLVLTPDFRQKHLLSEVTVRTWWGESEESLTQYLSYELWMASSREDVEAVTSLISAGADVDTNHLDYSPLIEAAKRGSTKIVSLLVNVGAKLDLQKKDGFSALMLAAKWGKTEVVSLLVKAGAALDLQDKWGQSALMLAALEGKTEVISLLVKAGGALDLQDKDGYSPLMLAGWRGETEVVALLMEAGAALDLQNNRGDSAVIMATTKYHLPVLNELVRAGADLNLQNEEGLTALMISSRSGRTELTKTLLSGQNISVDLQTITGWSALFFAAEVGEVETVDLLIKAGANLHLTDQNGLSAEAVAAASRGTREPSVPLATRITQGVKNTGRRAKHALLRLEKTLLEPKARSGGSGGRWENGDSQKRI